VEAMMAVFGATVSAMACNTLQRGVCWGWFGGSGSELCLRLARGL